jgi:hypothetical protein
MTDLYTCSFADYRREMGKPVRISLGRPKYKTQVDVDVNVWELTPHPSYFRASPEEFDRRYTAQLDRVGVVELWKQLRVLDDGRPLVLLCFERNGDDCHRRRFADWWLEQTGEIVSEIGQVEAQ